MNVLLIGGGAREHAIAWSLRKSPQLTRLIAAPGNPGIAQIAAVYPLQIPNPITATQRRISNFLREAIGLAKEVRANLVIIGGEAPLAFGLTDRLRGENIPVFGPSKAAAEIETSKAFGKKVCEEAGIPTADWGIFSDVGSAEQFIHEHPSFDGFVIKKDGLSDGKGATVTSSTQEALDLLVRLHESNYFEAGRRIVVEERLSGRETSAHAITDGETIVNTPFSCDYKRLKDGDEGPNTGSMGAYAPNTWFDESETKRLEGSITQRALATLWAMDKPFEGVLYPGIMVTEKSGPKVIEFNARFGDPEAQILLPLLETDLLEIMVAVANRKLHNTNVGWSEKAVVAVVIASEGYPDKPITDRPITGVDDIDEDILVFHAGTKRGNSGRLLTSGGRVLSIVAIGETLEEARKKVYNNVERIHFKGMQYRTDIGLH